MKDKHPSRVTLIFVLIILMSLPFATSAQDETGDSRSHIVIEIIGTAQYRDVNWDDGAWQPLSVGLPISTDWLIRPDGPSSVKILCADASPSNIREGIAASGCVDIPSISPIEDLLTNTNQRGDATNPNNVTILFPVNRIASTTPTITWEETRDFTTYRISIIDSGLEIFTTDVEGTFFTVPESAALERDKSYTIRVTPVSALNDPQFNFRDTVDVTILSGADFDQVSTRNQRVTSLTLQEVNSVDVVTYTEAWTFYEYALFSEAAISLSQIISPSTSNVDGDPVQLRTSPYPWILGGDTIRGAGLEDRAQVYYVQALSIAKNIGDRWIMAQILDRMATIEASSDISACYTDQAQALLASLTGGNDLDIETIGDC